MPAPLPAPPQRSATAASLLLACLATLLGGCLHAPFFATPYLLTGVAAGLQQAGSRPRCRAAAEPSSDLTPVELSLVSIACMRRGDTRTASLRLGLARAFAAYDQLRDPEAAAAGRQGWPGPMLPSLTVEEGLERDQLRALKREVSTMLTEPTRRWELCGLLRRIGPPTYSLDYRVNERFEVVFPRGRRGDPAGPKASEPAGFDRDSAWRQVLSPSQICPPAK